MNVSSRAAWGVAPSRGRGLKPHMAAHLRLVAGRPFTGAWIETLDIALADRAISCRPFTGAWIETGAVLGGPVGAVVAPSRGRGLKRRTNCLAPQGPHVAPSRGRGLKLWLFEQNPPAQTSPLHGGVD